MPLPICARLGVAAIPRGTLGWLGRLADYCAIRAQVTRTKHAEVGCAWGALTLGGADCVLKLGMLHFEAADEIEYLRSWKVIDGAAANNNTGGP